MSDAIAKMRQVSVHKGLLHIEAPGCIVNVYCGLQDTEGHNVTAVEILCDRYINEEWHLPDFEGASVLNVRVREDQREGEPS